MWKLWCVSVVLVSVGCATPKVVSQTEAEATVKPKVTLHPHPFWYKEPLPEVPRTMERSRAGVGPSWDAYIPKGAKLELWPGGTKVETCALDRVDVLEKQGDRVTLEIEGQELRFETYVSVRELTQQVTMVNAFLYDAGGRPFARIPKGWKFRTLEEDGALVWVCLDKPACKITGYLERAVLGPMTYSSGLRVSDRPKEMRSLSFWSKPQMITLHDADKKPLFEVEAYSLSVLARDSTWSEVLVSAKIRREGVSKRVSMYGYMPAEVERALKNAKLDPSNTLDVFKTRKPAPEIVWVHLRQGSWVYGAPSRAARMAQVRLKFASFAIRDGAPETPGWVPVWVNTPWGYKSGFLPKEFIQATRPPGRSSYAYRSYPKECRQPSPIDAKLP